MANKRSGKDCLFIGNFFVAITHREEPSCRHSGKQQTVQITDTIPKNETRNPPEDFDAQDLCT